MTSGSSRRWPMRSASCMRATSSSSARSKRSSRTLVIRTRNCSSAPYLRSTRMTVPSCAFRIRAEPRKRAPRLSVPSAMPAREGRLQNEPGPSPRTGEGHLWSDPSLRVLLQRRSGEDGMTTPIIEAQALVKHFPLTRSLANVFTGKPEEVVHAVDGVSLGVQPGETLGLIGESGSGKTTLGWFLSKLHEPTAGRVLFEGKDITGLWGQELLEWRRNVQIVFQDPVG